MVNSKAKICRYIYTLQTTEGTTGFASCVPENEINLETALAILAGRPLDTFLHRHALGLLRVSSPGKWLQLAEKAITSGLSCLAALLLELTLVNSRAAQILAPMRSQLESLASPWAENTPETLLVSGASGPDEKAWHENIHQHGRLPEILADESALREEKERLAQRVGLIARQKALFMPGGELPEKTDLAAFLKHVAGILEKSGPALGREMRHVSSLSPIALLRSWRLDASVVSGRNSHTVRGEAMAYGRGLKLAQARISCQMEIVERFCAHAQVQESGQWGSINGHELIRSSWNDLAKAGKAAVPPSALGAIALGDDVPLHWMSGEDSAGQAILVPAQAVFLFCNLDEVTLFEHIGSTGVASGATLADARLHALEEILERYAHATTCFTATNCFELFSRDSVVNGLLDDYRYRGIRVQFQDITPEWGVPAYRCFVQGKDGEIAQGTGASLNGARAALAALTETPWPYVWERPIAAHPGPGLANLPRLALEELPDFSLGSVRADLSLLECALQASGLNPVYVYLTRPGISLPVCRAFVPGLVLDTELERGPSLTLLARSKYFPEGHSCA